MAAAHSFYLQTLLKVIDNPDAVENTITSFPKKNFRYQFIIISNFKSGFLWDIYPSSRKLDTVPHCLNETICHYHYTQYPLVEKE